MSSELAGWLRRQRQARGWPIAEMARQLVPPLGRAAVIPAAQPPAGVAYRWMHEPDPGDPTVEREVLMAAHEGSHHAEGAERRDIGEATLEQLRADVVRLSREYMTAEPMPLFREMRRVRNRMLGALDRRLWQRDARQLYVSL